ncbi:hypothetical protein TNCV_4103031 [Trichonephila clavipes]|nr:hypothetical protein TNCV_4103031 [Trichonephila clavipes]
MLEFGNCRGEGAEHLNAALLRLLSNSTNIFSRVLEGNVETTKHRRTWGHKPRLVGENRDNNSRRKEMSQTKGVAKRMSALDATWSHMKLLMYGTPVAAVEAVASADIASTRPTILRPSDWLCYDQRCRNFKQYL